MKLKKRTRRTLIFLLIIILAVAGYFIYDKYFTTEVKKVVTIDSIPAYGYKLKDNKPEKYKKMFKQLKEILDEKPVDKEKYAKKITEMFIFDFYSLKDKSLKTDVGGVDFIHPDILTNYLENAENTYYKYVESNLYGKRKQDLPTVDKVTINKIEKTEYKYNNEVDSEAYKVNVKWTYTSSKYDDYQDEADLIIVHKDKKLYIVESIDPNEKED